MLLGLCPRQNELSQGHFLTSLLAGYEDLLKEFRAEDDKNCDVIIKYLNLLNDQQELEN